MNGSAGEKNAFRKKDVAPAKGRGEALKKKQSPPAKDLRLEAEDIARAVYDGMQDLRAEKSS